MWTVRTKVNDPTKRGGSRHYYNRFSTKRQAEMFARKIVPELRVKGYQIKDVLITNQEIGPK